MDEIERSVRPKQSELSRWENPHDRGLPVAWDGDSRLTWEQAVRVLRKNMWLLLAVIGGLTLAVATGAMILRDVYQPTARLEIDPLGGGIKTLHEIENPRSEADADYLDTQVQILQSDGLAMRVIRSLRLDQSLEFVSKKDLTNLSSIRTAEALKSSPPSQSSFLQEQMDLADASAVESAALRSFHRKLQVNAIRNSRLVEVSFAAHDPRLAQAVTNALVNQFIEQSYRNRYVTTMEASEWLSTQLDDLRHRVSESNRAVAEYQRKYGLVESDEKDVPLGQLMAEVSRQLSDAQADRIQSEAYARMVDLGQAETVPAVRDDVVYQNLLTRYAEIRGQLAQAQAIYGDENSNVKKLQNEATELTAQLEAERTRLVNRVRTSFEAAKAREQMMVESREKLRAQMGDASSHLVEYRMLKNEAVANATLYNTLEARLREAGIYAGLRSGNIHVIDMAPRLREATSPHRAMIIALGATLSVMFGLVLVFVRESLDNTVRIPDDIREWLRLPSLAVLPRVTEDSAARQLDYRSVEPFSLGVAAPAAGLYPKLFWQRPHTAEAEAIRGLRTSFKVTSWGHTPQVVLVSSATAEEGKTTVAINLASVLGQQGKTCLVEGDLRRPMIELAMGLNAKAGLVEVLNGTASVSDAIISSTGVTGLSVLPIKSVPENPADLLASGQMASILTALREMFEYIVIDSPPIIPFSDARSLALLSDAVILVSRYGCTTRRSITRAAEIISEMQVPLMGVVLNDMDLASADYHYFNYGYSWGLSSRRYEYAKKQASPLAPPPAKDSGPEKSRGAHA